MNGRNENCWLYFDTFMRKDVRSKGRKISERRWISKLWFAYCRVHKFISLNLWAKIHTCTCILNKNNILNPLIKFYATKDSPVSPTKLLGSRSSDRYIYIYIYVFSSRLFWMHTHARKKNIIPEAREWIIISPGFWLIQRYKSTRKTISLLNLYSCVPVDYLDEIDGMYFNGFSKKNQIIFIS